MKHLPFLKQMNAMRACQLLWRLIATALVIPCLNSRLGAQEGPRLVPFQGRLTDQNGAAVSDGARLVQFKIYNAPLGGQAVWNDQDIKNPQCFQGLLRCIGSGIAGAGREKPDPNPSRRKRAERLRKAGKG